MSGIGSRRTYNLRSLLELIKHYRSYSTIISSQVHISRSTASKLDHGSLMHQGLQLVNGNNGTSSTLLQKVVANVLKNKKSTPPAGPPSPRFNNSMWARWLVGAMLSLLVPFWKQKWDKLKRLEGEAEFVVEEVESVAEVVEKAATITEKISAEVAEKLPDNGKLKETALFMEHVSKTIAHDVQSTIDLLHKVETLKQDFDDIETMIEPAMEKIIQQKTEQSK